jgi:hypothetical protein
VGPFEGDGVGDGVDVGEDVGGEGVWVGGGVGDEPLKGVKPDKETAKKVTTNTVKTKTVTATYCFFMMEHQYNYKFIC